MENSALARNKKALHDYNIIDDLEVGIVLTGGEVKSIKNGGMNLKHSYVKVIDGKLQLINANVQQWPQDNSELYDPSRTRDLLIKKKELERLLTKVDQEGYTLVPLRAYLKKALIKFKIGIAKGKKQYEKKQSVIERDHDRDLKREMKKYQ